MEIGLALPRFRPAGATGAGGFGPASWEVVAGCALEAEAAGFGSVWVSDHRLVDGAGSPGVGFDPLVALGGLARATTSVGLGTLDVCSLLRPPTVLAKSLATVDVLSGGRLTVGIGVHGYEAELAAAGITCPTADVGVEMLSEAVQVIGGMFGGGPFTFRGRYASASAARCLPRPVQRPRPPVMITLPAEAGGGGDVLADVVAGGADGWSTAGRVTPQGYRRRLAVLDAACERAGRDPSSLLRTVGLATLVAGDDADLRRRWRHLRALAPPGGPARSSLDEWRRGRLVGTVEQVADQLQEWAALGVTTLVVDTGPVAWSAPPGDGVALVAAAARLGDHGRTRST